MEVFIIIKQGALKIIYFIIFALMFIASGHTKCAAAVYYVATNGLDANEGSLDFPWKTVQKAANMMLAGDITYVRAGTYNESQIEFANSGASNNVITIRNYPGETPVIDAGGTSGSYNTVFWIDGRHYITLDGLRMTGGAPANVYLSYNSPSTYIVIQNCELDHVVTDDNGAEIYINPDSDFITIQNNKLHDRIAGQYPNVGSGIIMFHANNITIKNNEIYNVPNGIYSKHGANELGVAYVENNYIHDVFHAGIEWNKSYAVIRNNLIISAGYGIYQSDGSANCPNQQSLQNQLAHNTIIGANGYVIGLDCDGTYVSNNTLQDNVVKFTNGELRGISLKAYGTIDNTITTLSYNLVHSDSYSQGLHVVNTNYDVTACPGTVTCSHNIASAPTFVGGPSPSTIEGFALTSVSAGHNAASDGTNMGADISVVGMKQVKIKETGAVYFTITNAYSVASDNNTILMRAMVYYDNLNLSREVPVTLAGGYDSAFSSNTGLTTINGSITIGGSGKALIENLILK
jgi:hypothetical protein